MLRKFNLFCRDNDNHQYEAIPQVDQQETTDSFNKLPADVLMLIAAEVAREGNWRDVIAFFLTNKKIFSYFEDFAGNDRLGTIVVTLPDTANQTSWATSFKNVNHILLANYFQYLTLDKLDNDRQILRERVDKEICINNTVTITLGALACASVTGVGGYLCHTSILPACTTKPSAALCCPGAECCSTSSCVTAQKIILCDIPCCGFMGVVVGDICWLPTSFGCCVWPTTANKYWRLNDMDDEARTFRHKIAHFNVDRPTSTQVQLFHANNLARQAKRDKKLLSQNDNDAPPRVQML